MPQRQGQSAQEALDQIMSNNFLDFDCNSDRREWPLSISLSYYPEQSLDL